MRQLIVDGYNTIHAWPSLKAVLRAGGLEEARGGLISRLSAYAAVRSLDVTVVFDGRRRGPATQPAEVVDGVTVIFSGGAGESADHYIERLCGEAARRGEATTVQVATADRLQRDMVGAMGVGTISAGDLEADVDAAVSEVNAAVRRLEDQARFPGRMENRIDAAARARLERLRRGGSNVTT
jgi:predicted RNA-binding protein with PIN domain